MNKVLSVDKFTKTVATKESCGEITVKVLDLYGRAEDSIRFTPAELSIVADMLGYRMEEKSNV